MEIDEYICTDLTSFNHQKAIKGHSYRLIRQTKDPRWSDNYAGIPPEPH